MCRSSVPDLSAYGLPRPDTGLYIRVREGAIPVQDVGLVDAVRTGRWEVVAAVESFDEDKVVLADGYADRPEVGDRRHRLPARPGGAGRPSRAC